MATCNPQTLVEDGACLACLDAKQFQVAKLALLCAILRALDPMASCDPQTLIADGACFDCLTGKQLQVAELQLLCNISESLGGGNIGGLSCGTSNPTGAPTGDCGWYYNRTTGAVFYWDSDLIDWVPVII